MNKKEFKEKPEVSTFADWLSEHAPKLDVYLQIKSSRFVPKGINTIAHGLDAVLSQYIWLENWESTQKTIAKFRKNLNAALRSLSNSEVLLECETILSWGGDRNPNRGAWKFLNEQPDIAHYIDACRQELQLSSANIGRLNTVKKMNSMLSKIHAFAADDGLPIYDSRVAAAIAALVELFRSTKNPSWVELPETLRFPWLADSRTVFNFNGSALNTGHMAYDTKLWTASKIKLGWLLELVLERNPQLFANESSRMHAFEASLFMIGYDVRCLLKGGAAEQSETGRKSRRRKTGKWSNAKAAGLVKTLKTLGQRAVAFEYAIDEDEVLIAYANAQTLLSIPLDKLAELIQRMRDTEFVLGAAQNDQTPDDISIGGWLLSERYSSRQHASRLAAVLNEEYDVNIIRERPLSFRAGSA